jgi:hypothetical protein
VQEEVARDEEEKAGDDSAVDRKGGPGSGRRDGQAYLLSAGTGLTLAPQAQTMLRVAHWMLRRRPQAVQLR